MDEYITENIDDLDDDDMQPFTADEILGIKARFDYRSALITQELLSTLGYSKNQPIQMSSNESDNYICIIVINPNGDNENILYMVEWDLSDTEPQNPKYELIEYSLYSVSHKDFNIYGKKLIQADELLIEISETEQDIYITEYMEGIKSNHPEVYAACQAEADFLNGKF